MHADWLAMPDLVAAMTAATGQIARLTTLVDGTLRVTIDLHVPALAERYEAAAAFSEVGAAVIIERRGDLDHTQGGGAQAESRAVSLQAPAAPRPTAAPAEGHRHWVDLKPSAQAALRCKEPAFWRYMDAADELSCVDRLRTRLGIESRAELNTASRKASVWRQIDDGYQAWLQYRDYPEVSRETTAA